MGTPRKERRQPPPLKVGDRVRVTRGRHNRGRVGRVVRVVEHGPPVERVEHEVELVYHGRPETWWFLRSSLHLIEEEG